MREERGRGREGGVTSGRKSSPRSGTFLGRGEGAGRGVGGGREEALTPRLLRARVLHRLATPGRRRTPERAWERAQARLGEGGRPARRPARRLRGDRFGVPLPSLSGGKEVPWRETAHAPPVGGFLASQTRSSAPGFSVPAPRSGPSHEFSVTDGAEKAPVIVTGYGFGESLAELGLGGMEVPGLFFQRPARSSGGSAVLAIYPVRGVEGEKPDRPRSSKGAEFVTTLSGTSAAESTASLGCDLCLEVMTAPGF